MNKKYIAVDSSISTTGVSLISMQGQNRFKIHFVGSISSAKKDFADDWKRKEFMLFQFKEIVEPFAEEVQFAVFENYSYGSPGRLAELGEITGLFKHHLYENEIAIEHITPKEVKKIIGGNGAADKKELRNGIPNFATNIKEIMFKNFDESDSVAVGLAYGVKMMELITNQ